MSETLLPPPLLAQPDLRTWLTIGPQQRVTVRTGKVEYGQGLLTALTQIAADAFCLEPSQVDLQSAHTDGWPNEGFTVGSTSVEESGPVMQALGRLVRGRLLEAASLALGLAPQSLQVQAGQVLHRGQPTGWDYWRAGAKLLEQNANLQSPWAALEAPRSVGLSLARVDLKAKFGGGAFINDLKLAGMRHAVVLRQPVQGAGLLSFDSHNFEARHPAVSWIRQGDFIACVASTQRAARAAHQTLAACTQWDTPAVDEVGHDAQAWLERQPAVQTVAMVGARPEALPSSDQIYEATWFRPFIAHASIGLSCGLAWLEDHTLQVWSHSQGIFALRDAIARVTGLAPGSVHVHHMQGAGCYGHNGADDVALDAALVAMAQPGVPIRVQWSREEELREGPLGAAMAVKIRASINQHGRIIDWETDIRSTSHLMRPGWWGKPNLLAAPAVDAQWQPEHDSDLPQERGGGATRSAKPVYAIDSCRLGLALVTSHVRTSALRSLGTFANILAIEGMMDELALRAGQDPAAFRLAHLTYPRGAAVLQRALDMAGWHQRARTGDENFQGIGLGRYKETGAWCAVVAEITLGSEVEVRRCWCAVDGGLIVNPDGARNQIEGGLIQALSWTLLEEVQFEGARPLAQGWEGYPILRFGQVPDLQTEFVGADLNPSLGLGEASQGPLGAAVANAVSQALGQRVTRLPISRERLMRLLSQ